MAEFKGRELKQDLTIDAHQSYHSGETIYTVCDSIGRVFDTIFEVRLEQFFAVPMEDMPIS